MSKKLNRILDQTVGKTRTTADKQRDKVDQVFETPKPKGGK